MAPRVTLDLFTRAWVYFKQRDWKRVQTNPMLQEALIVLLLLVPSPTSVSELIVYIRYTLQSCLPSGRAAVMRVT